MDGDVRTTQEQLSEELTKLQGSIYVVFEKTS